MGGDQLPRRLRRRLDRRRPHDLAAVPRRLARHGRPARHPQGRHDRAREGLRARRAPSTRSSGTASRCSAGCRPRTSSWPTTRDWASTDLSSRWKLTCGGSAGAHPHPQRLRGARPVVLAGLRHDRDLAGRDLAPPGDDARQAGQRGPAALLHRRAHRRRARRDGAARHGGRDRDLGPERVPGYHGTSPRRPRPPSRRTAGSARATSATWTPTATCTSPTGSRT